MCSYIVHWTIKHNDGYSLSAETRFYAINYRSALQTAYNEISADWPNADVLIDDYNTTSNIPKIRPIKISY